VHFLGARQRSIFDSFTNIFRFKRSISNSKEDDTNKSIKTARLKRDSMIKVPYVDPKNPIQMANLNSNNLNEKYGNVGRQGLLFNPMQQQMLALQQQAAMLQQHRYGQGQLGGYNRRRRPLYEDYDDSSDSDSDEYGYGGFYNPIRNGMFPPPPPLHMFGKRSIPDSEPARHDVEDIDGVRPSWDQTGETRDTQEFLDQIDASQKSSSELSQHDHLSRLRSRIGIKNEESTLDPIIYKSDFIMDDEVEEHENTNKDTVDTFRIDMSQGFGKEEPSSIDSNTGELKCRKFLFWTISSLNVLTQSIPWVSRVWLFLGCGAQSVRLHMLEDGTVVKIKNNPWLVQILKDRRHLCTGSIISNKYILTSKQCLNG